MRVFYLPLLIFFALFFTAPALAGFYFDYSLDYQSDADGGDTEEFSFSKMNNTIYLGASFDSAKRLIIGQSISQSTKTQTKGASDQATTITLLELGPRIHFYFTQERMWFASFTWNYSAKGTGDIGGADTTISGTSIAAALGYHVKVSKKFAMGAALNYHATTITSSIVSSTESEVTNTYTSIAPTFEVVFRF